MFRLFMQSPPPKMNNREWTGFSTPTQSTMAHSITTKLSRACMLTGHIHAHGLFSNTKSGAESKPTLCKTIGRWFPVFNIGNKSSSTSAPDARSSLLKHETHLQSTSSQEVQNSEPTAAREIQDAECKSSIMVRPTRRRMAFKTISKLAIKCRTLSVSRRARLRLPTCSFGPSFSTPNSISITPQDLAALAEHHNILTTSLSTAQATVHDQQKVVDAHEQTILLLRQSVASLRRSEQNWKSRAEKYQQWLIESKKAARMRAVRDNELSVRAKEAAEKKLDGQGIRWRGLARGLMEDRLGNLSDGWAENQCRAC